MRNSRLASIIEALRSAESFIITSHSNPDGDSIGSILSIYHLLRAMGKTRILCLSDGPVPRVYQWLPGASVISSDWGDIDAPDVAVVVDVARTDRCGASTNAVRSAKKIIILDHHLENDPDGDITYIDSAASAIGEIVIELFRQADVPLTHEAAECAYVSIATDTGGFRFANTTARSHRVAAELLEKGIDVAEVSSKVFDVMSQAKFELLRRVLHRVKRDIGGRLAYAVLTQQDMNEATAQNEDADGLVNYLRNIEGVEVGILFREVDGNSTKVSIRSRDGFNCAKFLTQFGGGGHARAAGATLGFPVERACLSILQCLRSSFEAVS